MSTERSAPPTWANAFVAGSQYRWLAAVVAVVSTALQPGCRDHAAPKPAPSTTTPTNPIKPGEAPVLAAVASTTCSAAVAANNTLPDRQRLHALAAACPVCDWPTIVRWGTSPTNGGPPLLQLRQALKACNVFCTGTADGNFFAGLEEAQGTSATRTPWRYLQTDCPALFAGGPAAARYAGAPWLALSRSLQIPAVQTVLRDARNIMELPLPLWTERGSGVTLPVVVASATTPLSRSARLITLMATEQLLGTLPWARIHGTSVEIMGTYPGRPVAMSEMTSNVPTDEPVVFVAPLALPAERVATAVTSTERGRIAVLTDVELANWPLVSALRGELTALSLADPSGLLIDIVHAQWASLPSLATSPNGRNTPPPPWQPLPSGPTLSARIASARSATPTFKTDQVVLFIDAQTTVATAVEWVAALAPVRWSMLSGASPAPH